MSLGGGFTLAANIATNDLIEAGVTVVVAAGNSNDDACNYSPASTLAAMTVGSTGDWGNPAAPISDARSAFSNWGSCLDLFAPGANIRSAWIGSDTAWLTISGTSMASPHVAGVAVLYLQAVRGALPATVRNYLIDFTTKNVVGDPVGSPNRLLYSGAASTLTLNATPEPITKGTLVTSAGTLSVGGKTLAGRSVQVWFDPAGAGAPVLKGSTTTSSTGFYSRTFPQSEDGSWYAVHEGSPLVGPGQSPLDFVDCTNC
jgi:subtilisin family serine protease